MRVRQRRDCLGLALEAPPAIGVVSVVGWKNLDRDDAVQASVARLVDFPHTPGTDEGDDFVRAETGAGHEGHGAKSEIIWHPGVLPEAHLGASAEVRADLQICNGEGLVKARKTPSTAKLSEPAPFAPTGWTTVWLDHLSFAVTNYKESVFFYSNQMGWQGSYDEGTQNEVMIGDMGDAIIRGGNPYDPNFGRPAAAGGRRGRGAAPADDAALAVAPGRRALIDHISFGISPWDVDGVQADLEKRSLSVSVDTSSAHPGPDGKMVSDDIHQAAFRAITRRHPTGTTCKSAG